MKKSSYLFIPVLTICLLLCFSCGEDTVTETNPEICNNGIDDDGDGLTDCDDSDCINNAACITAPAEICNNGIDDDGDGDTDCEDSECTGDAVCVETPEEICNNGIDDDGNGHIDCFDSECSNFSEAVFTATFSGQYQMLFMGTPIPNGITSTDNLIIGNGSSSTDLDVTITSDVFALLNVDGTITSCDRIDLADNIVIPEYIRGQDTFFNIQLGDDSHILISETTDTLKINFTDITIEDGTLNATLLGGYPLENIAFRSHNSGSIRQ